MNDYHPESQFFTVTYIWDVQHLAKAMVEGMRCLCKSRWYWTPVRILGIFTLAIILAGVPVAFLLWLTFAQRAIRLTVLLPLIVVYFISASAFKAHHVALAYAPWGSRTMEKILLTHTNDLLSERTVIVTGDRIMTSGARSSQEYEIQQVFAVERTADNLIVLLKTPAYIAIPLSAFSSDEEINTLTSQIQKKIPE